MMNPFFTKEEVKDFKSALTCDTEKFKKFFWKMTENGVFLPPSQFEAWFISTAITNNDLKTIETAIELAMESVAVSS
jgi:glutamate-1-semialdehyde 2,1-aminomutase